MKQEIFKSKLLLVDDDYATRLLIKLTLEGTNIDVIEATCSSEALDRFGKYASDFFLVVLDISLPGCDGCELLRQFRRERPYLPAISVSAITPAELAVKSKTAGFNRYITKPFNIEEVRRIITSYLDIS
jgi:two-component system, response regulator, stage 0 sporulation protein F